MAQIGSAGPQKKRATCAAGAVPRSLGKRARLPSFVAYMRGFSPALWALPPYPQVAALDGEMQARGADRAALAALTAQQEPLAAKLEAW